MKEKLDFSSLKQVIKSLAEAIDVVADEQWFKQQKITVQNTLIAGVIQNFEFVYELSIKMLKRQMEIESASPEEVDFTSFRGLFSFPRCAWERI
ncbi:MAG: nucleotidyltransferase substrate binding protein [Methylococcaceae bacterium]